MSEYKIYWIKRKHHDDPYNQGYVGLTKSLEKRINTHFKNRTNYIVSRNIQKYKNDIEVVILHEELDKHTAAEVEFEYRPTTRIGWNIMPGGSIPPLIIGNNEQRSKNMMGEKNPFFGKTHSDETKKLLSTQKSGKKHPFFGKRRKEHSLLMKEKAGEKYPRFRGHFVTPMGKFDSFKIASEKTGMPACSIYNYCIYNNEKTVSKLSYEKSKFLKTLGSKHDIVGKTYKQLGFDFNYV